MEKALENKYEQLQDENLNLMVEHVNKDGNPPYSQEIRTNFTLMTKIGQIQRALKKIPLANY